MVSHRQLTDQQIADVISYVRSGFGNKLEPVSPQEVEAAR
jgi:mono/diheme cytochrome c family protein